MMGEETVHNDLILDQYAVIGELEILRSYLKDEFNSNFVSALTGGKMNYKHFEAARALLFRKFKLFRKV